MSARKKTAAPRLYAVEGVASFRFELTIDAMTAADARRAVEGIGTLEGVDLCALRIESVKVTK